MYSTDILVADALLIALLNINTMHVAALVADCVGHRIPQSLPGQIYGHDRRLLPSNLLVAPQ